MNTADYIAHYVKLRDKVDAMTKAFEESLVPYRQGMDAITGALTQEMDRLGTDSIKVNDVGTAYRSTVMGCKVADRDTFFKFVLDNEAVGFLTSAVTKESVKEYIDEHKCPPPGIDVTFIKKLNIRRSS